MTEALVTRHLDPAAIRAEFPALQQMVNSHPLVYLDSAATSQKPRAVLTAMEEFYERDNANVHRGVHRLSERATAKYEGARQAVARFLGGSPQEVVFVRGTTEAINLVAHSFVRPRLRKGDEVLITHMEHHSNIVPWQIACQDAGATLKVAPIQDDGSLDVNAFGSLLSERTRFASFAHVSNALGTINPVQQMTQMCHDRGVPVLVDGAQAAPHLPIDVAAIGCDFYAVSGHKMYGPTGIGALWGKLEHLEAMRPYQGGGEMIRRVTFEETTYNDVPHKFEAGTPDIAGAIGLGAACEFLMATGRELVQQHEQDLLAYATEELGAIQGLSIIGTAPDKAGVIAFNLDGIHPHDVGSLLDQHGVAIRTGHHCAQPVMDRFGVPATCRISLAMYNTREDIVAAVAAIRKVQEMFA